MDITNALYMEIDIIILAILLVILGSLKSLERSRRVRCFSAAVYTLAFSSVASLLGKLILAGGHDIPEAVLAGLVAIYYIFFCFCAYFVFLFSKSVSDNSFFNSRARVLMATVPVVLYMAAIFLSIKNGCIFSLSAVGYKRGAWFPLHQIFIYGYIIIGAVSCYLSSLIRRKQTLHDERVCFALFSVVPTITFMLQFFVGRLPVLSIGLAMLFLILQMYNLQMCISIDHLTNLNTRKALYDYIEHKLPSVKAEERLYILFMDIDSFKEANDTYGHSEGDRILIMVADCIKRVCEETGGFCARYGGDEFVMVQVLDENEDIARIRKKVYDAVERKSESAGLAYSVRVSIGCSEYGRETTDIQALIAEADNKKYNKKARRKQIFNL